MSDQTILLRTEGDDGKRDNLVLRCYQGAGLLREQTDLVRHYFVLRSLQGTPVPVPPVRWYEPDASILGGPFFVMDEVPGQVPIPWSPEGRAFLAEAGRGPIADAFIAILAAIHDVDWRASELVALPAPDGPRGFARGKLTELQDSVYAHQSEPEPILEDGLDRLRASVPEAVATTLVHGDYRTGNLIYNGSDRIAAVLDWEFACLGDPVLDLAWVCAPSNRTGSDLVCFLMARERFLDGYAAMAGWRASADSLAFWELYHQIRHTAIWLSAASAYAAGRSTDVRLARMSYALPRMRRMVADLLGGY